MAYVTNLTGSTSRFADMMENGFGVVTVMNARVYNALDNYDTQTAYQIASNPGIELCRLDTLKIANVTMEGPNKTVTGGQYSNPLIKFGKSARLEMQDALGRAKAIEVLGAGIQEWENSKAAASLTGLHFGEDFAGPKMIIGDSFFIDRKTGQQVDVTLVFYQFLPDSIFNLSQDAEGDATVFDMNGDLLTTNILVGNTESQQQKHGVFYSIIDRVEPVTYYTITKNDGDNNYTLTRKKVDNATIKVDGTEINNDTHTLEPTNAYRISVEVADEEVLVEVWSK